MMDIMLLSGCMYLSDIKSAKYSFAVSESLEQIRPDNYSLEAWGELGTYMCGSVRSFLSQDEASAYLIEYLSKKNVLKDDSKRTL